MAIMAQQSPKSSPNRIASTKDEVTQVTKGRSYNKRWSDASDEVTKLQRNYDIIMYIYHRISPLTQNTLYTHIIRCHIHTLSFIHTYTQSINSNPHYIMRYKHGNGHSNTPGSHLRIVTSALIAVSRNMVRRPRTPEVSTATGSTINLSESEQQFAFLAFWDVRWTYQVVAGEGIRACDVHHKVPPQNGKISIASGFLASFWCRPAGLSWEGKPAASRPYRGPQTFWTTAHSIGT